MLVINKELLKNISYRHEQGESIRSISKDLSLDANRICRNLREEGYQVYKTKIREPMLLRAELLLSQGQTLGQAASSVGLSLECLSKYMKSRGINCGQSIPTEEEVLLALSRYLRGESLLNIANSMGFYYETLTKYMKVKGCRVERGMGSSIEPLDFKYLDEIWDKYPALDTYIGHELSNLYNPEAHYWLGMLAADGYITDKGMIRLGLIDEEVINNFKSFMGITSRTTITKPKALSHHPLYYTQTNNTQLKDFLISIGITPRKTHTIKMAIPISFPFIRGLIDGDGCVHVRSESPGCIVVSIVSASLPFLEQVSNFLTEHRIVNKIGSKQGSVWSLTISNKDNVYNLYKALYYKANNYMARKREKYSPLFVDREDPFLSDQEV